jgi:peptide subunit release factor RF-3
MNTSHRDRLAYARLVSGTGDTVYDGAQIDYPPVPSFAPEHFMTANAKDLGRYKQFRKGIEQLDQEGVVQVLRSDLRGAQARSSPRWGRCSSRWSRSG